MFRMSLLPSSGPIPKFETATSSNVCFPSICRITRSQNSEYHNLNSHTRGNWSLTSFEDLLLIINYYHSNKLRLNISHIDCQHLFSFKPTSAGKFILCSGRFASGSVPTDSEAHAGDY
jgi:hypothetical protein